MQCYAAAASCVEETVVRAAKRRAWKFAYPGLR